MPPVGRWGGVALAVALLPAGLVGCSTAASTERPGTLSVVASTNVWGGVAAQVGGRWVSVTSLIANPDQDPHSYEGSARVLLSVSKADLLIQNGGGYDDFMRQLVDAADVSVPIVDAVAVSGHRAPPGGELNEHVWYDVHTAERVASVIAARLGDLAPQHRGEFAANARAFSARVDALIAQERQFAADHGGEGVGITEPVPLYMLQAMGLHNLTPPAFSSAVEEGSDVAARVLAATLDLYSSHRVSALVYNEQTSSPITEQVKAAARAAAIPVVPVTETEPLGMDYQTWMQRNLTAIERAVTGR